MHDGSTLDAVFVRECGWWGKAFVVTFIAVAFFGHHEGYD